MKNHKTSYSNSSKLKASYELWEQNFVHIAQSFGRETSVCSEAADLSGRQESQTGHKK